MIFYYPDGDGGRRILDTGGDTYINTTQQGAMIIRGRINTLEIYNHLKTLRGEVGDLWTLTFDDAENNIYSGDLLIWDGEDWQHLGTSPSRPFYSLPTASESVKGGIVIGDGFFMTGDTLNAVTETIAPAQEYFLPTASSSIKGGIIVGDGLYMDGDVLKILPQDDEKRSINIKNILKNNGGSGEISGGSSGYETIVAEPYELPTMSETIKGGAKNGAGLVMSGEVVSVDLRTAVETVAGAASDLLYPIVDEKFSIPNDVWEKCIAWVEYAPNEAYGAYPGPPEGNEGYQINFAYSNVKDATGNYDTFSSITIHGIDYVQRVWEKISVKKPNGEIRMANAPRK